MPRFTQQVDAAVMALTEDPSLTAVDENELIDASRLVYDGIRDIRKAVLMIRVSAADFHPPPPPYMLMVNSSTFIHKYLCIAAQSEELLEPLSIIVKLRIH